MISTGGGKNVVIIWAIVDVLSAVARAAVWVIDRANGNVEELQRYRFENHSTEDQTNGDEE